MPSVSKLEGGVNTSFECPTRHACDEHFELPGVLAEADPPVDASAEERPFGCQVLNVHSTDPPPTSGWPGRSAIDRLAGSLSARVLAAKAVSPRWGGNVGETPVPPATPSDSHSPLGDASQWRAVARPTGAKANFKRSSAKGAYARLPRHQHRTRLGATSLDQSLQLPQITWQPSTTSRPRHD